MPKNPKSGQSLLRDQKRAITGLLAYGSVAAAGVRLKISPHRIRHWLREDKAFNAEFKKAINAVYEGTIIQAKAMTEKALKRLSELIDSDDEEIAMKALDKALALGFDVDLFQRANNGNDGNAETPVQGVNRIGGRLGNPSLN